MKFCPIVNKLSWIWRPMALKKKGEGVTNVNKPFYIDPPAVKLRL